MSAMSNGPVHSRARWVRPTVYRATLARPFRLPRPVVLRSSCGHVLGVGYVWKHQGYIAWKRCDRGAR